MTDIGDSIESKPDKIYQIWFPDIVNESTSALRASWKL